MGPIEARIEFESSDVSVWGYGEVGGWYRLMERGEEGVRRQRIRLFLETLFLCAGCIRRFLAVLLVYGSPLELY